jgi:hypothetical protein
VKFNEKDRPMALPSEGRNKPGANEEDPVNATAVETVDAAEFSTASW